LELPIVGACDDEFALYKHGGLTGDRDSAPIDDGSRQDDSRLVALLSFELRRGFVGSCHRLGGHRRAEGD
jgi:hypothetical protein